MTPSADINPAPGWPRPRGEYRPFGEREIAKVGYESAMLPVPWATDLSHDRKTVYWTALTDDCERAHTERLCQVCGEELGATILLGHASHRRTNGSGCHPRCMATSIQFCPHFPKGEDA